MKLMNTITREHHALLKEMLTKTTRVFIPSVHDVTEVIIIPRKIPTLLHN